MISEDVDVVNRARNNNATSIAGNKAEPGIGDVIDRIYLIPADAFLSIDHAVIEYLDLIPFLQPPSDHGDDINDKESNCEKKIEQVLTDVKGDKGCEKEQE
jgi:hypothetical protein